MNQKYLQNYCHSYYKNTRQSEFIKRITVCLVLVGIVMEWGAAVFLAQSTGQVPDNRFIAPMSKPLLYYILHSIGVIAVITGGILAGLSGAYMRLSKPMRVAFWLLQITSITWAFFAYNLDDFMSFRAFGATGSFVWIGCVLIFAGMDRSIWNWLDPTIRILSYVTALFALFAMIAVNFNVYERWESHLVQYMVLLMWFGGWTLLTCGNKYGLRLYLSLFPFLVFILISIVTRTRSWFLMSILIYFALFLVDKRIKHRDRIIKPKYIILYIFIMLFLIASFFFREALSNLFAGLWERRFVDSRTGQYVEFFSQVSIKDLILGRGPKGIWHWGGRNYQFFDNAYLWMLFIGGLPILVSYFFLIIWPGIKSFLKGARENDAVASVLIILWGLTCIGFGTYADPSLSSYCYILYLMAGRCLGYLAETRQTADGGIKIHTTV